MPDAPIKRSPYTILAGGRNSRMTELLIKKSPGTPMETPSSLNVDAKKIGGVAKRKGKAQQGNNVSGSDYLSQSTDNATFFVMQGVVEAEETTNNGDETASGVSLGGGSEIARLAQKITIGGSDVTLTQIAMYGAVNSTGGSASLSLTIYSDSSGSPGSAILDGTSDDIYTDEATNSSLRIFRFSATPTLSAGASYWLVLTGQGTASVTLYAGANTSSGSDLRVLTGWSPEVWASQTGTLFYRVMKSDAGGDDFWYAQQVTPASNGDVISVTFDVSMFGSGVLQYTALIYSDTGSDAPNTVVTNGTSTTQVATSSTTPANVTFNFPIAPSLTAATKYWLVIKFENPSKQAVGFLGGDSGSGALMRKSNENTPNWIANGTGQLFYSAQASGDATTCQGLFDYQLESSGTFSQKVMAFFGGKLYYKDGSSYTALTGALTSGQDVLVDFAVASNLLFFCDYANDNNRVWNGVEAGTPSQSTMQHGYRASFSAATAATGGTWSGTGWVRLMAVTTMNSGGYRASAYVDIDIDNTGKHINVNTVKMDKAYDEFTFDVDDDATLFFMSPVVGTSGTTDTDLLDRQTLYKIPDAAIANADTGSSAQPLSDSVDNFDITTDSGLTSENTLLDEYSKDQTYFTNQVATPRAKFLASGFGYVLMAGDPNNTSRVWQSAQYGPQIWSTDGGTAGDFYEIGEENDGQKVRAIYVWGGGFYAFKDKDVYFYSFTADTTIAFVPTKLKSNGMSCLSHFAIVEMPEGLVFPTQTGMAIIRQGSDVVEPFAQEKIGDLFESGSSDSFNLTAMEFSTAANNQNKRLAVFGTSTNAATTRDRVLVYDYEIGGWWTRDGVSANYFASVADSDGFPEFWSGDYSGKVFKHDTGTDDDGAVISFEIDTPYLIFGDPDQAKRIRRLTLKGEVQSSGTLSVDVYKDYDDDTIVTTLSYDMSDARFKTWLEASLNVTCRAIKFKFKNSEANTDVQLDGFVVHYQDLGIRR